MEREPLRLPTRRLLILPAIIWAAAASPAATAPAVKSWEGTVTIPTYQHTARETQPPLFGNSTVTGLYPFTTYVMPFRPGDPKPKTYRAVFVENEYLKLTYLPELGGRIFSLYDKLRKREVFYRNDVIKPAHYNPRLSWPQSGIELTGPHDLHMLTLYGEPFWSNTVVRRDDGSISLVLGEIDPVYHMNVNLSATLHPGVAALEIGIFCYNRRDGRMPQMFWISASLPATEKTRFHYPMSRTIGHTTSEIADWPVYNGVDYSWDRNNKHMLGVFGIDIYDNYQGAYHHDLDYGVFRSADRRIVQGMKMWTFGYGPNSKNYERGYTDNAGPYVEVQSGRHVWDGHYEWVAPRQVESWKEWWIPVAGTNGLTTITRDIALNLETGSDPGIRIAATRAIAGATISVTAGTRELLRRVVDLAPAAPFRASVAMPDSGSVAVKVTGRDGHELMNYVRPDGNPGRKEYTPFTEPLERPQKTREQMSIEELVLAAEFKLKELSAKAGLELLDQAIKRDPGYSRAHLILGIHHFNGARYDVAAGHLRQAIARDPYLDEAYYYLAMSQFALGLDQAAERNLYYIWPGSAWFGAREYHLGRVAYLRGNLDDAASRLTRAIVANGVDLEARLMLALVSRENGKPDAARKQLEEVERIDPSNRIAAAERFFLDKAPAAQKEFLRLTGGQSQEAIDVSLFYRRLRKWKEAAEVLRKVEAANRDPWGTPPEFYYTLAWYLKQTGDAAGAAEYRKKAAGSAANIDRFAYREESEQPLADAVADDPNDSVARFHLGCLLYHRERPAEAIGQWEAAVKSAPGDFASHRALGLAYAEQGRPIEESAAQLEKAVALNPAHVRTLNDLSALYANAGKFDEQLAVLSKALARSPADDDLAEGVLTASLAKGRYNEAEKLIANHTFAPRHRTYGLRDLYRFLRYGMAAIAYREGRHAAALELVASALKPPTSLGTDDFVDSAPRAHYYTGRILEAMGHRSEATQAYEQSIRGFDQLSGDRDSLNSENFHMVLSLDRLGRGEEASTLARRFDSFATGEMNSRNARLRSEARYLLGLVRKRERRFDDARKQMESAIAAQPVSIGPRLELRRDVIDPLPQ